VHLPAVAQNLPGRNACLSAHLDARLYAYVIGDTHLARKHHMVPDDCAPRDAHHRRNDRVFADPNVVRHVREIVDVRAAPHDGRSERAAVNRDVRADVHVVVDREPAELGKALRPSRGLIAHEAESRAAQYAAGLDAHSIAELRAGVNHDMRTDVAVAFDPDIPLDDGPDPDLRAGTIGRRGREHGIAARHGRRVDTRAWIDHGGWVEFRRGRTSRRKQRRGHACECQARLIADEDGLVPRTLGRRQRRRDSGRAGGQRMVQVASMLDKDQVPRLRMVDDGDIRHVDRVAAAQLRANQEGQHSRGNRHDSQLLDAAPQSRSTIAPAIEAAAPGGPMRARPCCPRHARSDGSANSLDTASATWAGGPSTSIAAPPRRRSWVRRRDLVDWGPVPMQVTTT
jgi:hypothetical protein